MQRITTSTSHRGSFDTIHLNPETRRQRAKINLHTGKKGTYRKPLLVLVLPIDTSINITRPRLLQISPFHPSSHPSNLGCIPYGYNPQTEAPRELSTQRVRQSLVPCFTNHACCFVLLLLAPEEVQIALPQQNKQHFIQLHTTTVCVCSCSGYLCQTYPIIYLPCVCDKNHIQLRHEAEMQPHGLYVQRRDKGWKMPPHGSQRVLAGRCMKTLTEAARCLRA